MGSFNIDTLIANIGQFITNPLEGISLVAIGVAAAAAHDARHRRLHAAPWAIGGGAVIVGIGWAMQKLYGVSVTF